MQIPNIKSKIASIVDDYFNDIKNSPIKEEVNEELESIFEDLNSEDLIDLIVHAIENHIFRFDSGKYAGQYCHTCQKKFGDFVSKNGATVSADALLKDGSIVILD